MTGLEWDKTQGVNHKQPYDYFAECEDGSYFKIVRSKMLKVWWVTFRPAGETPTGRRKQQKIVPGPEAFHGFRTLDEAKAAVEALLEQGAAQ